MKMNRTAALAAMLALAGVGCSGSHGANAQTRAPAQQPASDSAAAGSAASESAAPAEANHVTDSRLPIYPGATKQHEQFQGIMKICGATMSMTAYAIKDADAATVAKWYKDRIPSGVQVSISPDTNSTNYEIFEPDGSGAAVVTQVHFAGNLAKAAKSIGADETTFATETFDPPLSSDVITLLVQGAGSDASAKQAAREQLKAKCGDSGLKAGG